MDEIIKLIATLQSTCKKTNIEMDLPQIAVVGSQSSGKSSVLERIIGFDVLPKSSGLCTRVPLIITMLNVPNQKILIAKFNHLNDLQNQEKFQTNNQQENEKNIRDEIFNRTNILTGPNEIKDIPIFLELRHENLTNLLMVDLPGETKIAIQGQTTEIVDNIRNMILEYIKKPNCIILAVSSANVDLATSDSLKLAQISDTTGNRTIGVLTKIDIMDRGVDAMDYLENKIYPLKLGYIGVINRSQEDLNNNISLNESRESEKEFFMKHNKYSSISNRLGTDFLVQKCSTVIKALINKELPRIKKRVQEELSIIEEKLAGKQLDDVSDSSKARRILTNIIRDYVNTVNRNIESHIDQRELEKLIKEQEHGLKKINNNINESFIRPKKILIENNRLGETIQLKTNIL